MTIWTRGEKSKEINIVNKLNKILKQSSWENSNLDKTAFLDSVASLHLLHKQAPTEKNIPKQQQKNVTIPNMQLTKTSKTIKNKDWLTNGGGQNWKHYTRTYKKISLLHHHYMMPAAKYFFETGVLITKGKNYFSKDGVTPSIKYCAFPIYKIKKIHHQIVFHLYKTKRYTLKNWLSESNNDTKTTTTMNLFFHCPTAIKN